MPYAHIVCSNACSLSAMSFYTFLFFISILKYIHPMKLKQKS